MKFIFLTKIIPFFWHSIHYTCESIHTNYLNYMKMNQIPCDRDKFCVINVSFLDEIRAWNTCENFINASVLFFVPSFVSSEQNLVLYWFVCVFIHVAAYVCTQKTFECTVKYQCCLHWLDCQIEWYTKREMVYLLSHFVCCIAQ